MFAYYLQDYVPSLIVYLYISLNKVHSSAFSQCFVEGIMQLPEVIVPGGV